MGEKKFILFLTIIPLLVFLYINLIYSNEVYPILSGVMNKMSTYSDSCEDGDSVVTKFSYDNNKINFEYIIGGENPAPYAGFYIEPEKPFSNFKSYDYFIINISSSKSKSLVITFQTSIPASAKIKNNNTYCPFEYNLTIDESQKQYKIRLNNFMPATWWFQENMLTMADKPDVGFHNIQEISFEQNNLKMENIKDSIIITEIKIVRDRKKYLIITSIFFICFYLVSFFIFVILKVIKSKLPAISYKCISPDNVSKNQDITRIIEYIGANYSDPCLSIDKISLNVNIASYKIPIAIKRNFNCTFPQYLNTIRLSEAKRLLSETDMMIIDIAMSVGYSNVSHFNHLFKKETNRSPGNYRKTNK